MTERIRLLIGDCRESMRTLMAESVQCCVTSPPYWGLRDYGHDGQLGLKKTPEEYVANMVEVMIRDYCGRNGITIPEQVAPVRARPKRAKRGQPPRQKRAP